MNEIWIVRLPRTTYEGMCAYFQTWGGVYRQEGVVILPGSINHPFTALAREFTDQVGGAQRLGSLFERAMVALGSAKVGKTEVVLDLRDLTEEQVDAFCLIAPLVKLRPSQIRSMNAITNALVAYNQLPDMIKLAIASSD